MNTLAFAVAVVAQYFLLDTRERPIDKKIERAKIQGMFTAAQRLGIGMTDFEVEITFLDALNEWTKIQGARPQWRAIDNSAQKSWDEGLAQRYSEALKSL